MSSDTRDPLAPRSAARAGDDADPHDHVVFRMSSGATITFNDPRRFGVMDLVPRGLLPQHPALGAMGPEPLCAGVRCRRARAGLRRTEDGPEGRAARSARGRRAWATSTRARRSILPGSRRGGERPGSRRHRARRATAPCGWSVRSRRSCRMRSTGRRVAIIDRHDSASTIAKVSRAQRHAAAGRSGDSRKPAVRRSTARSARQAEVYEDPADLLQHLDEVGGRRNRD